MNRLARDSGVHASLILEYCGGLRVPTLATAEKLAKELGTAPETVILECLRDRWSLPVHEPPEHLMSGRHLPVLLALNAIRQMSLAPEVNEGFRERMEQAGELVLEAIAEEFAT